MLFDKVFRFFEKKSGRTVFKLRGMFCGQMCKNYWQHIIDNLKPYVCFNFVVHRPGFQKNIGFNSKISDENLQKMGKHLLVFGDKFLVIPILNRKYMPCLPNATLSNDGNVPGITLWVRKMISYIISTKN